MNILLIGKPINDETSNGIGWMRPMGKNILRRPLSLGCETYVADRDTSARTLASDAGARIVAEHVNDLPQADGIIVATPTSTHTAALRQALSRGW